MVLGVTLAEPLAMPHWTPSVAFTISFNSHASPSRVHAEIYAQVCQKLGMEPGFQSTLCPAAVGPGPFPCACKLQWGRGKEMPTLRHQGVDINSKWQKSDAGWLTK